MNEELYLRDLEDRHYDNYSRRIRLEPVPEWKTPFMTRDRSQPTNKGFKQLSPKRVAKRRAKNKAARKARKS